MGADLHRQRWLIALFGVGVLAVVARAAMTSAVWSLPDRYLLNADSAQYHHYALVLAGLVKGELPRIFDLSPLATLWGALWHSLFGPSPQAVIIPQILILGSGTALLVASSARRLAGTSAGVAAGVLVAICEPLVFYDCAVLATPLAVFLAAATLHATLLSAERPTLIRCAGLGLLTGLWIVCRPNTLLFVPVALAIVAFPRLEPGALSRWARTVVLVGCTVAPVLPFTITNAVRGDAFVPVTSSAGINLFIGNNQGATGRLESVFGEHSAAESLAVFRDKAEQTEGRPLDAAEVSSFWIDQTWHEIADDPERFAALLGKKLAYGVNDFEAPDSWNIPFLETELPPVASWLPGFGLLLALGLPGLILLWRRGPPGRRAVHGTCGVALITMLAFFVAGRYRAPMIPALAIAAGATLSWIAERIQALTAETFGRRNERLRQRAARGLAGAAVLVALAANNSNLPILESRDDIELERLARALASEQRYDEALDRIERLFDLAQASHDDAMYERASQTARELIPVTLKNEQLQ
ncbi:MAG: glycosyltransferase family 39 protein [Deltaproteobacteria bacterium]|nr:glycosyltransferase family 39 protein [Deltaproteobacteria bacterium]